MLNPGLYKQLKHRFGSVKISNEGEPREVFLARDAFDPTKVREQTIQGGEQYRVCCPYCADNRYRLYFSYQWRIRKPDGQIYGRGLAHCFNEECNLSNLENELQAYLAEMPIIKRNVRVRTTPLFQPVDLPGRCIPLDQLGPAHPAIRYIRDRRRFDPAELAKVWQVHYCDDTAEDAEGYVPGTKWHARLVRNRIVVPVFWSGRMVGWQARSIIEGERIKYYTMPGLKKQQLLYNGDRAREHSFGVVVEGVTDAWRIGPRAVALLGKTISYYQKNLLYIYWQRTGMCLLLDPDALDEMEKIDKMINLKGFAWGAFALRLPGGCDPADLDHDQLMDHIRDCARNNNIQLPTRDLI